MPPLRLVNNVSISFGGADAQELLRDLDDAGIACSAGAACGATTIEPSHVLLAMNFPLERAASTLRLTIGHEITDADIDYVLATLPPIVERSRRSQLAAAG